MRSELTDDEVEREIEELEQSELVKLARKEARLKYARRQRLYNLRNLQKRGQQLKEAGVTFADLERKARVQSPDYDPLLDPENEDLVFQ